MASLLPSHLFFIITAVLHLLPFQPAASVTPPPSTCLSPPPTAPRPVFQQQHKTIS
ncbi:hypothetical protein A2U01_0117224, partial [Trifolium medium]|nr:hypothetical protein [Trifolium medium]